MREIVASNIFAHNAKLKTYLRDMAPVIAMKPDTLIMADPGLIMMVRDEWPDVPIHLSVQANAVNWADVKFWHRMGLTRVILSRELSLDEIEEIRQRCPEMELEVFVHGASEAERSQYVGDVLGIEDGWVRIEVKNRFAVGDRIELDPSLDRALLARYL